MFYLWTLRWEIIKDTIYGALSDNKWKVVWVFYCRRLRASLESLNLFQPSATYSIFSLESLIKKLSLQFVLSNLKLEQLRTDEVSSTTPTSVPIKTMKLMTNKHVVLYSLHFVGLVLTLFCCLSCDASHVNRWRGNNLTDPLNEITNNWLSLWKNCSTKCSLYD
jgi:hypothetical protein